MEIIQTTLPEKKAISEIVAEYRKLQGEGRMMPLRAFAEELSEVIRDIGLTISHQSIKNWQDRSHLPKTFIILQIKLNSPMDWRRDFAQDILAVLNPDIYQPASLIGVRAIKTRRSAVVRLNYSSRTGVAPQNASAAVSS